MKSVRRWRAILTMVLVSGVAAAPAWADHVEVGLRAPGVEAGDLFGYSVGLDGDWAAVGAYRAGSDKAGAVHLFARRAGVWRRSTVLTAAAPEANGGFGFALALDADTLVVTATGDGGTRRAPGSVEIFRRSGDAWAHEQTLTPPDAETATHFGRSLALDDDTLVVGDAGDTAADAQSGKAHVFVRQGTNWSLQQTLTSDAPAKFERFGGAVALDGDTLVVTARGTKVGGRAIGSAFVFTRSGTTWSLDQRLIPDDPVTDDAFGDAVDIDGDTLVVGAEDISHSGTFFDGAAFVFTRDGAWSQVARLVASDPKRNQRLGTSVELRGTMLAVGARGDRSITVFEGAGGTWAEQEIITGSDAGIAGSFGSAIALGGDVILAGVSRAPPNVGVALLFDPNAVSVPPSAYIVPRKVRLTLPAPGKRAATPGLTASGTLDTGALPADLSLPAWLTIGSRVFALGAPSSRKGGRSFLVDDGTVRLEIKPDARGGSRSSFRLAFTGDLAGAVTLDGDLILRYETDEFEAGCVVTTARGAYKLGKVPGSLKSPSLDVRQAKIKLKGAGKDSFAVTLGFAADGAPPAAASDVTIAVGTLRVTIPADRFRRKGARDVFKGDIDGVRSVTVDHAKGTVRVRAKGLTLDAAPEGASALGFALDVGAGESSVTVRVVRKGKTLRG